MKKQQKEAQKAKEKAEKMQQAVPTENKPEKASKHVENEEPKDEVVRIVGFASNFDTILNGKFCQGYHDFRVKMVEEMRKNGVEPYPHKFHVDISLTEFIEKYGYLEKDNNLPDVLLSLAGKVFEFKPSHLYIICLLRLKFSQKEYFRQNLCFRSRSCQTRIVTKVNFLRFTRRRSLFASYGKRENLRKRCGRIFKNQRIN